jgi:dTDP-4-dehydrorhamnose reductase
MRILITGASGLLGLNMDAVSASAVSILQADLLAPGVLEQVLDQTQPDWIIHCAALANIDNCETDPELAHRMNALLPGKLAGLCIALRRAQSEAHVARGGARVDTVHPDGIRLVHISTDAVFDGQKGDYTEVDTPNPLSVYALTKLEGERSVTDINPDATIARVNLFGWSMAGKRSLAEFFFNNLSAGKQVMGFTDVYFCPLLANDLAHILLDMLEKRLNGLYHVVSRSSTSKYDFGVAVAQRFGLDERLIIPVSVAAAGLKAARSPNLTLRTDKLDAALGEPLPSWAEGLERFYELYRQGYPQMLQQMAG